MEEIKTIFPRRKVGKLVTDEPKIKDMLIGVLQAEDNGMEWKLRCAETEKHWVTDC